MSFNLSQLVAINQNVLIYNFREMTIDLLLQGSETRIFDWNVYDAVGLLFLWCRKYHFAGRLALFVTAVPSLVMFT